MFMVAVSVGRASHPDAPEQIATGAPVYAPSPIAARGGKFRFLPGSPGYIKVADPTVLIAQFEQAAMNSKEAGFDGVELHGANGYSFTSFSNLPLTSGPTNRVGIPENRARFALETIKVLVEVWGPDALEISPAPSGISLAGGDNDVGMPLRETVDTFGYLLRVVNKLRLSSSQAKKTQHHTRREAEELVESGKAAGVCFGASRITHPDLGGRITAGQALDNKLDVAHLYGAEGVDPALGYLDYKEVTY
ncbi:hypothetical protein B0H19DRAFT_1269038 [Mycena capillaripes]|nr:hypothetical protein B0H19DRAFT_1269038 [Mycena capillaripes]